MSEFWVKYLALCTALLALWAQVQAALDAPFLQPENSAYPAPVVTQAAPAPDYLWVDACGVLHRTQPPMPWPTAVPVEDLEKVCK